MFSLVDNIRKTTLLKFLLITYKLIVDLA